MARLHAGSAVTDDVFWRDAVDVRGKPRAQLFWRPECAALIDVPPEKIIRRARNVSSHRIYWFKIAAIALGRA